jgi:hypothetical protein
MYILIQFSEDGDSMILFNDLDKAKEKFSEARSEMDSSFEDEFSSSIEQISLLKVEVGVEFGSGSWGDFFGGEIIDNYESEK